MVIISLMILIIAIAVTPNLSTPAHLPYGGSVDVGVSDSFSLNKSELNIDSNKENLTPNSLSESFILSNGGISPIQISRLTSIVFLFSGALAYNALYIQSIGSGLSIYSGLFQVTVLSQSFDLFIFVLAALILIP